MDYLKVLAFMGIMIAIIFGSAGRWDLPFVWATVGIYVTFMLTMLFSMDRDLMRERVRPGPGGKDRSERALMMPVMVGQWLVAGLDIGRFHWSDTVPRIVQICALIGFVLALALAAWAMAANRFFSSVVRIQHERGHHLITTGPYQYIRHPGYLGGMISSVGGTLALGSWWALAPTGIFVLLFIRRVVIEDGFLHQELAGYAAYAKTVRYRLLPGLW